MYFSIFCYVNTTDDLDLDRIFTLKKMRLPFVLAVFAMVFTVINCYSDEEAWNDYKVSLKINRTMNSYSAVKKLPVAGRVA